MVEVWALALLTYIHSCCISLTAPPLQPTYTLVVLVSQHHPFTRVWHTSPEILGYMNMQFFVGAMRPWDASTNHNHAHLAAKHVMGFMQATCGG